MTDRCQDDDDEFACDLAFADKLEADGDVDSARAFRRAIDRMRRLRQHPMSLLIDSLVERLRADARDASPAARVDDGAPSVEDVALATSAYGDLFVDAFETDEIETLLWKTGHSTAAIAAARTIVQNARSLALRSEREIV